MDKGGKYTSTFTLKKGVRRWKPRQMGQIRWKRASIFRSAIPTFWRRQLLQVPLVGLPLLQCTVSLERLYREVPRLDGAQARNKFGAPMFEP